MYFYLYILCVCVCVLPPCYAVVTQATLDRLAVMYVRRASGVRDVRLHVLVSMTPSAHHWMAPVPAKLDGLEVSLKSYYGHGILVRGISLG